MRTKRPFNFLTLYLFRTPPSLRTPKYYHWKILHSSKFNFINISQNLFQSIRHFLMHFSRIIARNNIRLITISRKQTNKCLITHSSHNSRIRNLITIKMQNRKNHTIYLRINKLINTPRS